MTEAYEIGSAELFRDLATPYDAIKTAEQAVQFTIDPSKGVNKRRYHWFSNNTLFDESFVSSDDGRGVINLDTTTTGTDTVRIQSSLAGQYISHTLAQPGLGFDVDTSNISYDSNNLTQLSHGQMALGVGWHDKTTGGWGVGGPVNTFLGILLEDDGAKAVLVSNGNHLGNSPVSQSDWNMDKMDGSETSDNPSGLTFKPDNGYIYNFPYSWYAHGALYVGVIHPSENKFVPFHKFVVDRSSFDRPNVCPMAILDNGGVNSQLSGSLGGLQYVLYGGSEVDSEVRGVDTSRITPSNYIGTQVVTNNEAVDPSSEPGVPLIAVRRESGVRDTAVSAEEVIPETAGDVYIFAWDEYDETAITGGTWRVPHDTLQPRETRLEVNTGVTGYTPSSKAVARGWDKHVVSGNKSESSFLDTDDRIPIDGIRIYSAVNADGTATDGEFKFRFVEGY